MLAPCFSLSFWHRCPTIYSPTSLSGWWGLYSPSEAVYWWHQCASAFPLCGYLCDCDLLCWLCVLLHHQCLSCGGTCVRLVAVRWVFRWGKEGCVVGGGGRRSGDQYWWGCDCQMSPHSRRHLVWNGKYCADWAASICSAPHPHPIHPIHSRPLPPVSPLLPPVCPLLTPHYYVPADPYNPATALPHDHCWYWFRVFGSFRYYSNSQMRNLLAILYELHLIW